MHILTKEGYERFENEQTQLIKDRIIALQDMVRMRELGDLSENAGHRAAKSKLRRIDNRIRFLEKLLRTSRIVKPPKANLQQVTLGSRVTFHDHSKTFTYLIVDSIESDVTQGKISMRSPLGKALVGKNVGDVIRVNTPQGMRTIAIDSLKY